MWCQAAVYRCLPSSSPVSCVHSYSLLPHLLQSEDRCHWLVVSLLPLDWMSSSQSGPLQQHTTATQSQYVMIHPAWWFLQSRTATNLIIVHAFYLPVGILLHQRAAVYRYGDVFHAVVLLLIGLWGTQGGGGCQKEANDSVCRKGPGRKPHHGLVKMAQKHKTESQRHGDTFG